MVVEDGTGLTNSNSYTTVAEADAYFTASNDTGWNSEATTADKEYALIKATASVDLLFGEQFASKPNDFDQALLWPRIGFYNTQNQYVASNTIPTRLKNAVAEVAKLSMQGINILPDKSTNAVVTEKSEELDGLKRSYKYDQSQSASNETLSGFYKIELMLTPLLKGGSDFRPSYLSL